MVINFKPLKAFLDDNYKEGYGKYRVKLCFAVCGAPKGDIGNTCLLWQKMIMTQMFEKHVKHRFREMKQLGMHDSLQLVK
jgi:hypothetical protein